MKIQIIQVKKVLSTATVTLMLEKWTRKDKHKDMEPEPMSMVMYMKVILEITNQMVSVK